MVSSREKKKAVVEDYREKVSSSPAVYFVDVTGVSADQVVEMRKKLEASGATINVVKNTLIKLAAKEVIDDLPDFQGSTAMIVTAQDLVVGAKVVAEEREKHKKLYKQQQEAIKVKESRGEELGERKLQEEILRVRFGFVDGQVVDAEKVYYLASLPGREQLLAQLASLLVQPTRQFATMLNTPLRDFASVVKQKSDEATE